MVGVGQRIKLQSWVTALFYSQAVTSMGQALGKVLACLLARMTVPMAWHHAELDLVLTRWSLLGC